MRTFELREYTLRTKEALDFYSQTIYPRHPESFPLFGIEGQGFWTAKEDVEQRLFCAGLRCGGKEPAEVTRRYMPSTEFADDIEGFDMDNITNVDRSIECVILSSYL